MVISRTPTRAERPRVLLFGRFEVLELLGTGGFGRVVRALDTETSGIVALKELHRFSGDALLHFKREFRALADVHHPSLVRLGELFESEGQWGFTMEYVPGTDFLSWVRSPASALGFDEQRLRRGLLELARGLVALHHLGLLHRDVKPQNVRVTPEGRVVLLDFGLVTHLRSEHVTDSAGGTAAYMAPEQALTGSIDQAADLYALGVLLYEALTGRLPFEGTGFEIMLGKQRDRPPAPSTHVPEIPADLDALCVALLARDPAARPDGRSLVRSLGGAGSSIPAPRLDARGPEDVFVGRAAELSALSDFAVRARDDGLTLVLVEGESGVGKSALVHQLVTDMRDDRPSLVVLEGRCHAAEQVPFKMFDGVIDELSRTLRLLDEHTCRALLPEGAETLPALFPVLGRVEAIAHEARRASAGAPPERVDRFTGFRAVSELLRELAERQPMLLVVDDLQWGDAESISMLRTLLDAPRPAHALLIATVRCLDSLEGALADELRTLATHPRVHRLRVGPLARHEALELSARWLGASAESPRVLDIASEAGGHPLFIAELASHASDGRGSAPTSLDDALLLRTSRLDDSARLVLELLAVAGAPTSLRVLGEAAGADAETIDRASTVLRAARLARVTRRGELACYHDRVREALLRRQTEAERRAHHTSLARAAIAQRERDPAEVARHLMGAARVDEAFPWLIRAAEEATGKAAFEKAVEHYRTLLTACRTRLAEQEAHELELALAESLAGAGRSAESARVLLTALDTAQPEARRELRVRAAQRLLQAGEVAEGTVAARAALEEAGLAWPHSAGTAVLRLLWHRAVLALRGLHTTPRPEHEVDEHVRAQLDTLWRLWQPLLWADMARGAELSARHLSLALERGPERHSSLALCGEAVLLAVQRVAKNACAEWLDLESTVRAAREDAELNAYRMFTRGYVKFIGWRVHDAAVDLVEAERLYREDCPSEAWMLANVRGALLVAWFNLGEHKRSSSHAERWIAEAEARGDRFALASCAAIGHGIVRHLMRDDPARAHAEIQRAMAPFSTGPVGGQQLGELSARTLVHMYVGGRGTYDYWQEIWPRFKASYLARATFSRDLFIWSRAEAALRAAVVEEGATRERLLRESKQLLRGVSKRSGAVLQALALLGRAQIHVLEGERKVAREIIRDAHLTFCQAGHYMRFSSALLLAHLDQTRSVTQAHDDIREWLRGEGWSNLDQAVRMMLPIVALL